MTNLRMHICTTGIFAALVLAVQTQAQQPRYKLIDLGTFGGPNSFTNGRTSRFSAITESTPVKQKHPPPIRSPRSARTRIALFSTHRSFEMASS